MKWVFDYLVTIGTNQWDDLEQLVHFLFGNLADSWLIDFRARRLSASSILRCPRATFKLRPSPPSPRFPAPCLPGRAFVRRGIYERLNLTAAREIKRRRQLGAYNPAQLRIEEDSGGNEDPAWWAPPGLQSATII